MPLYTTFEPPRGQSLETRAMDTAFVYEGFSWGAFLATPVWLIWRRMWTVMLAYLAGVIALGVLLDWSGASPAVSLIAAIALALVFGFEGNAMRRASLTAKGWSETGFVLGATRGQAEEIYFAQRLSRLAPAPAGTLA